MSKKSEYTNSLYFFKNNLALPTYPELNLKQVKYICDCINHFYEKIIKNVFKYFYRVIKKIIYYYKLLCCLYNSS